MESAIKFVEKGRTIFEKRRAGALKILWTVRIMKLY